MHSVTGQLIGLQRIASFSVQLRGHDMGAWRTDNQSAVASCLHCGRELYAYCSLLQPDIEGPALEDYCVPRAAEAA